MGVLLALLVDGGVLVSQQSRLFKEIGHGALIALRSYLQSCYERSPGRIGPGPLFAEGLGVVYGPK